MMLITKGPHIDPQKLPEHVAIIMDGNGRWAQLQGQSRSIGHKKGLERVQEIIEASAKMGISYLTLYCFSQENWQRPSAEITILMDLLSHALEKVKNSLIKYNIRLTAIGDLKRLPLQCQNKLTDLISLSKHHTSMRLILALSYSGRWDITTAVRNIAQAVSQGKADPKTVNEALIEQHLSTAGIPDPALLIRTSGEMRISNFLLWQMAYTELFITDVFWPAFTKQHLQEAILEYQNRERRFGKTREQLNESARE